jgi:hypothetical protein
MIVEAMRRLYEKRKASGKTFKAPRDPRPFWRAYQNAARGLAKWTRIFEYQIANNADEAELRRAAEHVAYFQRLSNSYDNEVKVRIRAAKSKGTAEFLHFMAPRVAWRARQNQKRNRNRTITDGLVDTGLTIDGVKILESVS